MLGKSGLIEGGRPRACYLRFVQGGSINGVGWQFRSLRINDFLAATGARELTQPPYCCGP